MTYSDVGDIPVDELMHYGVKGMKWGVRKDRTGPSRATLRSAKKDADEFAKAKMFYGEGAGTRRKLIKAKVEARAKKDPEYKKAFDEALSGQDLGKRANQAKRARARADVSKSTKKTAKGIGHVLRGNSQYANVTAVAAVTAGTLWYNNGGSATVNRVFNQAVNSPQAQSFIRAGFDAMRGSGF